MCPPFRRIPLPSSAAASDFPPFSNPNSCPYWTLGGLLRNFSVGSKTRKLKKNSKSKVAIIRDSSTSNSAVLHSDLEMFSTPLKLNQASDWCGWIENGRELNGEIVGAVGDSTVEGSGSSDHLAISGGNEGMVEISGASSSMVVPGSNSTN
ncbi:unnamed protein product [Citrullus colocynthis]|uniref:Uncharacterized protein n=1 Tax=Citrullus colocynthis TaxID=252529 RepID=A0ABP0Y0B6_9ROSI